MVSTLASIVVILGLVAVVVGSITFIISAFRTSILWGVGVLVFGPISLAYLICHWSAAKKPFFLQLWGLGFIFAAALVSSADLPWPLG